MSDNNARNRNTPSPFFARFLEAQFGAELSEAEMASVSGGGEYVTLAYPSDVDGGHGYEFPSVEMPKMPSMPSMPSMPEFPSKPDRYNK